MKTLRDDRAETWLTVAHAHGDHLVHLAARGAGCQESMCGRTLRARPPQRSFRHSGCEECLVVAREAGHLVAQEDRAWLNLTRILIASLSD